MVDRDLFRAFQQRFVDNAEFGFFATREEAEKAFIAYATLGDTEDRETYCYKDNFRCAFGDDTKALTEYINQWSKGCCGFMEVVSMVAGRPYLMGFNYGH